MTAGDIELITNVFNKLSYDDLLKCREKLDSAISKSFNEKQMKLHSHVPNKYIEYHDNFLPTNSIEYAGIHSELETLHMKPQKEGPDSKWLTTTNLAYTWESHSGHVTVKNPTEINNYPFISKLMEDINSKFDANMNSCLVNYYKTGNSKVRYHDDGEDDIDQNQPICIISIGAQRSVDFLYQDQDHRSKPVHSIKPVDGSLYKMNAGCQQTFKHHVKKESSVTGERYCLSFRRRKLTEEVKTSPNQYPSSPVKDLITQFESGSVSLLTEQTNTTSEQKQNTPSFKSKKYKFKKKNTTVIFGSSTTSRLIGTKLATRGRKVINISQSGAKIRYILRNVEFFHEINPAADNVDKIVFSLGTNDIKYSRTGVLHLKRILLN